MPTLYATIPTGLAHQVDLVRGEGVARDHDRGVGQDGPRMGVVVGLHEEDATVVEHLPLHRVVPRDRADRLVDEHDRAIAAALGGTVAQYGHGGGHRVPSWSSAGSVV